MNETSRIKIDPLKDSLNLERFRIGDTFGAYIDKLNRNFDEIQGNFGGPMGPHGPQGPPGCKGEAGPQGAPGESDLNWRSLQSKKCDSDAYNNEDSSDAILNRFTNASVLLSNLFVTDDSKFKSASWFDSKIASEKVSNYFAKYKLKLYNSAENGFGEHIHLLNTKAVEKDWRFLCESGFTISNDFDAPSINRETLRIVARKNSNRLTCPECGSSASPNASPLLEHITNVEVISDLFTLKQNFKSQALNINTNDVDVNINSLTFTLDTQTKVNEVNLPDRSGYNAVWEDTNERSESWEVLNAIDEDFVIYRSTYLDADYASQLILQDDVHWVGMDPGSVIRFKRMNNWVLVDFHIGLTRRPTHDTFTLRNIQFMVTKPTLSCKTIGWHPTSILENEDVDEDSSAVSCYGHFKVIGTDLGDNNYSFIIANKFPYNIYNLLFDSSDPLGAESYWLTGQVWATVCGAEGTCDLLSIEQCTVCPSSMIVQNT